MKEVTEVRLPSKPLFYKYNALMEVKLVTGQMPNVMDDGDEFLIRFRYPISEDRAEVVKQIFEGPGTPPKHSNSILVIRDLDTFFEELGPHMFINTSDGKRPDLIEIHFDKPLADAEKQEVLEKYAAFASFKQ